MQIEVQGINIHYEVIGHGRPFLMLHGGGLDHRHMIDELEPLFVRYPNWKRIYPDLPGQGRTPAADWIFNQEQVLDIVLDFVDQVIPNQGFALAGTSRGGYLARGLIYRRPASVEGALLIVPASATAGAAPDQPHVTLVQDENLLSELMPGEIGHFQLLVLQTRNALDRLRQTYYPALALRDGALRDRIVQNYDFPFDVNKPLAPFAKPVLIVTGAQDDITGFRDAWKMMDTFTRATFVVLDKAGHLLPLEQEQLFMALASEWLQRVEESVGSQ
jgi:pimeloyl-ACP methyl ester carboxylesterase